MPGVASHPRVLLRPTPVFIVGLLLGLLLQHVRPLPIWAPVSDLHRWLGALAIALGAIWFTWGVQTMRRARTGVMLDKPARRVVTEGPYRWSRNPQYLAYTTMCIGAACVANAWWPIVLLPVVLLVVQVAVIAPEEQYMIGTFGAQYEDYRRQVGRWL